MFKPIFQLSARDSRLQPDPENPKSIYGEDENPIFLHKGLGLRKVLKKVLKALKKILLTQKRTQKIKCTFLSTQKSTQ